MGSCPWCALKPCTPQLPPTQTLLAPQHSWSPMSLVPRVPLTAELRAGLHPCGQAEEDQGHHDRGHHGATAPLCRCPLVPAAAGAGAGAGTAVTMAPSVPCGGTGAASDSCGCMGTGRRGHGFEGSVWPSRCSAAEQIEGAQLGPQPAPRSPRGGCRRPPGCTCALISISAHVRSFSAGGGREGLPALPPVPANTHGHRALLCAWQQQSRLLVCRPQINCRKVWAYPSWSGAGSSNWGCDKKEKKKTQPFYAK